ncbi:MAG: hypothetical protein ACJZ8Y_03825 [Pirellulaceae bacterium]
MTEQGNQTGFTRRGFLRENAMGLGLVALASLLQDEKLLGVPRNVKLEPQKFDLTAKQPHFRAQSQGDDFAVSARRSVAYGLVRS